ncbi:ubiquinone anaerobic biosynthesis protein UbiV [Alcaligenes endophyticus]|uniref:Ubiquinone biosynthesis protein UbiV n=1 Tax=Alcaligenes endophyticus TaxID=1929088 RepID=A0ABT8EM19_9BURK|nr:U32 family peptidase [Alcaligenes endophyticus]MCX5591289.1 U32 family peptidase [Alcaligenes endophyticus]MDN4122135.1 U32 family peptidase [Alcaligenes endophyticus]
MKLSLGPLHYYWSRLAVLQFYEQACEWPVDIVYLGENVCSRRHAMRFNDWLEVAAMLSAAGKEVVLSTQTLLESNKDMKVLEQVCANPDYMVEANDMGAVHSLQGKRFVAGPYLNVYSPPSLQCMHELGACRWVMPLEMGAAQLQSLLAHAPAALATEIFAYGRMPLAFSARCFSARYRNLPKDNCQYVCQEYPDGLVLHTREGESFLTINGIQTQSAKVHSLMLELPELQALGVQVIRLSPQSQHMGQVVSLYHAVSMGQITAQQAYPQLVAFMPDKSCNGYWHARAGLAQINDTGGQIHG